jgi:hypothetical protein
MSASSSLDFLATGFLIAPCAVGPKFQNFSASVLSTSAL